MRPIAQETLPMFVDVVFIKEDATNVCLSIPRTYRSVEHRSDNTVVLTLENGESITIEGIPIQDIQSEMYLAKQIASYFNVPISDQEPTFVVDCRPEMR